MKEILLNYLWCPYDKSDFHLVVTNKIGEEIISGELCCVSCKRKYLVKGGIPVILEPNEIHGQEKQMADGFGYEWNEWKEMASDVQSINFLIGYPLLIKNFLKTR